MTQIHAIIRETQQATEDAYQAEKLAPIREQINAIAGGVTC